MGKVLSLASLASVVVLALLENAAAESVAGPRAAQLHKARLTLPAPGIARNPRGEMVSVETSIGHGLCAYTTRLVFRDAELAVRASMSLVESNDYPYGPRDESEASADEQCQEGKPPPRWAPGAAKVARRVAAANRKLAEQGFAPISGEVGTGPGRSESGAYTTRFGDLGLVVGEDGSARFFLKQRMLAEHGPGSLTPGHLVTAVLSTEQNRVFVVTKHIEAEREEQVWMGALPIPDRDAKTAPKPTARQKRKPMP